MDASNALLKSEPVDVEPAEPCARPAAVLKGTSRGLEALVDGRASIDEIMLALTTRLDEAPGFFRGSDVRVRVEDGPLAAGCLTRLDEIATRFELRIVEVSARKLPEADAVPRPSLAAGSAPSPSSSLPPGSLAIAPLPAAAVATTDHATAFDDEPTNSAGLAMPDDTAATPDTLHAEPATLATTELTALVELPEDAISFDEPTQTAVPLSLAATAEIELETVTRGPRLVVGPVRSGVILEHHGTLIVFGDINPGAEVRAEGNIVVLGRLRGTAHAGIGQDVGFILAIRLEPQQLRIGRRVARAADSDTPGTNPEIAYCTGDSIVVESYQGKLPRNLATSI